MKRFYHKAYWGKYINIPIIEKYKFKGMWVAIHNTHNPDNKSHEFRFMTSELSTGVSLLPHKEAVPSLKTVIQRTNAIIRMNHRRLDKCMGNFKQMNILPEE